MYLMGDELEWHPVVTNHDKTSKCQAECRWNGKISELFTLQEPYNKQTKINVSSLSSVKYQWTFMSNGNATVVKGYTCLSVEQIRVIVDIISQKISLRPH